MGQNGYYVIVLWIRNNMSMKLSAFSELIVISTYYDKVTLKCIERDGQFGKRP